MKINWRHPDIFVSWRAVVAELLGTIIFVFLGTMSATLAIPTEPLSVALGHIFGLIMCIHMFGPISGAHLNCAVTFSALITRNIGLMTGLVYIIVQFIGSIIGSALCLGIGKSVDKAIFVVPEEWDDAIRCFCLELLLTFILVMTIFGTAVKPQHFKKKDGFQSLGGLIAAFPIAFAMGANAMAGGRMSGACMNPNRAFGPQVIANIWPDHSWIYYTAPFIGGALGALCFEFVITKPKSLDQYTSLHHIKTEEHEPPVEEISPQQKVVKNTDLEQPLLTTSEL